MVQMAKVVLMGECDISVLMQMMHCNADDPDVGVVTKGRKFTRMQSDWKMFLTKMKEMKMEMRMTE